MAHTIRRPTNALVIDVSRPAAFAQHFHKLFLRSVFRRAQTLQVTEILTQMFNTALLAKICHAGVLYTLMQNNQ